MASECLTETSWLFILPTYNHAPYTAIVVPVRKRGVSSKISRSPEKRHMDAATEATTAVVKDANLLDLAEAVESSNRLPNAVAAQKASLQAMKRGRFF